MVGEGRLASEEKGRGRRSQRLETRRAAPGIPGGDSKLPGPAPSEGDGIAKLQGTRSLHTGVIPGGNGA